MIICRALDIFTFGVKSFTALQNRILINVVSAGTSNILRIDIARAKGAPIRICVRGNVLKAPVVADERLLLFAARFKNRIEIFTLLLFGIPLADTRLALTDAGPAEGALSSPDLLEEHRKILERRVHETALPPTHSAVLRSSMMRHSSTGNLS